jgi:hypothetical protein
MQRGGTVGFVRARAVIASALWLAGACAPAASVSKAPKPIASSSVAPAASSAEKPPPPPPLELAALSEGTSWPPSAITQLMDDAEPSEGQWVAVAPPWMHRIPDGPPALYRTFVRPDRARPKSRILLVAMDARQLDFDMEPGTEDPRFVVGGRIKKEGRLPRTKDVATRVVAVWNGGFRTEHGFYGVMMKKHLFIPPVPHAATVALTDDGRFGFGTWGPDATIEPSFLSFRQNLDPLLDGGVINPRGRPRWGGTMGSDLTKRSAMCLTHTGNVVYGWGNDVNFGALAKGLQLAGCQYALHLDMNPIHTGFLFMSFDDEQYKKGKTEVLTLPMGGINKRFVEPNAKDFFYAMLHDPTHPTATRSAPLSGRIAWQPDAGAQPPPAWLPAVFHGRAGDVEAWLFERDRVGFALRLGEDERAISSDADARAAWSTLQGDAAHRAIASVGLGAAPAGAPLGATIDGQAAIPTVKGVATLALDARGALSIGDGDASTTGASLTALAQGPWLVRDGEPMGSASSAVRARVGVGLTREGHLVVAQGRVTEAALAAALIEAGAIVALGDRGAGEPSVVRAGGEAKLFARNPGTTLFVLARAMAPRTFRWDRDLDGAARWPEWKTPIK